MEPPKTFTFDAIYDWNSTQIDIFEETFQGLVDSVLKGFNGTIFAYGQTGTGKTFTMEGIVQKMFLPCDKIYSNDKFLYRMLLNVVELFAEFRLTIRQLFLTFFLF